MLEGGLTCGAVRRTSPRRPSPRAAYRPWKRPAIGRAWNSPSVADLCFREVFTANTAFFVVLDVTRRYSALQLDLQKKMTSLGVRRGAKMSDGEFEDEDWSSALSWRNLRVTNVPIGTRQFCPRKGVGEEARGLPQETISKRR